MLIDRAGRVLVEPDLRPYRYDDRGSLATIGRSAAVAVVGRLHLSGFVAWLAWLFIRVLNAIRRSQAEPSRAQAPLSIR